MNNENQQWLEANNHDLDDDQFERLVDNIQSSGLRSGYDMSVNQARSLAMQAIKKVDKKSSE